jgi:hypothetical protein
LVGLAPKWRTILLANDFLTLDTGVAGRREPNSYLRAANFHHRDADAISDQQGLRWLSSEYAHGFLPPTMIPIPAPRLNSGVPPQSGVPPKWSHKGHITAATKMEASPFCG